ncbi:gibberellin 20-oxidase-like protein [Cryptomeria japonica]|uniref:gibberellin 20-oxidase-like protein n=1 Tax=Cryptomeria japonica TaxID=3369 RepID=UPI0027DA3861|nr:gibberellin 20-oxidase-like protein [Cryptomeria japonica]
MPSSLQSHVDLPLIDISQFPSEFDCKTLNCLQNNPGLAVVREACKEWGFFYVGNHGIPIDLLQQMEFQSRQIYSVLAEAKERAVTCDPFMSYQCRGNAESFTMLNLPESDSINELSNKIWPLEEKSAMFSETFRTYSLHMAELARKICKIILASLGLDAENFYHLHFENFTAYMRINHYFSDAKSVEEELLLGHTDIGCFTILYQDNNGGLQIRSKEGEWLNVKPISHSFVVNLGDSMKAWSNGIYRSAEHRVVCKGWVDRFSVPYFVRFPRDQQIWAPDELVNDEHPRRYRP